jgi:hypothetical protein
VVMRSIFIEDCRFFGEVVVIDKRRQRVTLCPASNELVSRSF